MTDQSGSTTFTYDSRGRLTGKSNIVEGITYNLSRVYTPGGRISTMTYPTSRTVDYHRASCMCKVDSITTTYNSITKTLMQGLTYRPFGGAKAMNTGGGGTVGSTFNDAGKMTVSNPGATHEKTYTYDNNGNLTSITAPSLPYQSRVYGYDNLDRLTHAEGPWGNIDYTYDDVGNRQTETVNTVPKAFTYEAGTNKLDTVGGTTIYTYDDNGNIVGIGNRSLIYNQDNRLTRVQEDSNILGEYTYNGLGQRIKKVAGATATIFHYDFDGNIIGESNLIGTFSKEYVYRSSSRLAMVNVANGAIYFYGNDSLGTPQILTDSTNTVVWEANYKPFGEVAVNPNSEVVNNFRFPGQYYDSETGLHYNYHRYYEPTTGRYLTPDPIGQLGGFNLYDYVVNNPINETDIYGLDGGVISIPVALYALGKAIVFVGSAIIAAYAVDSAISDDEDAPGSDVLPVEQAKEKAECEEPDNECYPPEGTKCYEGPDYGKSHGGLSPHYHIYQMQKRRPNGICFWRYLGGKVGVGVLNTPPVGMCSISE